MLLFWYIVFCICVWKKNTLKNVAISKIVIQDATPCSHPLLVKSSNGYVLHPVSSASLMSPRWKPAAATSLSQTSFFYPQGFWKPLFTMIYTKMAKTSTCKIRSKYHNDFSLVHCALVENSLCPGYLLLPWKEMKAPRQRFAHMQLDGWGTQPFSNNLVITVTNYCLSLTQTTSAILVLLGDSLSLPFTVGFYWQWFNCSLEWQHLRADSPGPRGGISGQWRLHLLSELRLGNQCTDRNHQKIQEGWKKPNRQGHTMCSWYSHSKGDFLWTGS